MSVALIRNGDTVLARFKVRDAAPMETKVIRVVDGEGDVISILRADIVVVEHRQLEPGDRVTLPPAVSNFVWTIVAIDEDGEAWLKRDADGAAVRTSYHVAELRAAS